MKFNDLSIQEKAAVIKLGVGSGLRSLLLIEDLYNSIQSGGNRPMAVRTMDKSNADFAKRMRDPRRMTIRDWVNSADRATHKMAWAEDDVSPYIYSVVQRHGNYLKDYSDPRYSYNDAAQIALLNGDYMRTLNPLEAEWLTTNYKDYYPGFKDPLVNASIGREYNMPDYRAIAMTSSPMYGIEWNPDDDELDYRDIRNRQLYLESAGKVGAKSNKGAQGIFQIMPGTAKWYQDSTGDIGDIWDPVYNERVRDWTMDRNWESDVVKEGNPSNKTRMKKTLAAFNYGVGNLLKALDKAKRDGVDIINGDAWLDYLPDETRNYVNFIMNGLDASEYKTLEKYQEWLGSGNEHIKAYGGLVFDGDEYRKGGSIHIKPLNRGKFTALKKRTGHSATWFKEHGTPALRKMATFALNARKWHHKHPDGGSLFERFNKLQLERQRYFDTVPIANGPNDSDRVKLHEVMVSAPPLYLDKDLGMAYNNDTNEYYPAASMEKAKFGLKPLYPASGALALDWRTFAAEMAIPTAASGMFGLIPETAELLGGSKYGQYIYNGIKALGPGSKEWWSLPLWKQIGTFALDAGFTAKSANDFVNEPNVENAAYTTLGLMPYISPAAMKGYEYLNPKLYNTFRPLVHKANMAKHDIYNFFTALNRLLKDVKTVVSDIHKETDISEAYQKLKKAALVNSYSLPVRIKKNTVRFEKLSMEDRNKLGQSIVDKGKADSYSVNSNGDLILNVKNGDYINIDLGKSGDYTITDFYTGLKYSGNVTQPLIAGGESTYTFKNPDPTNIINRDEINLSHPDITGIKVNGLPNTTGNISDIISGNIRYVLEKIPGFKPFGSAVGVSEKGINHITGDIDGFITKEDLIKYSKNNPVMARPLGDNAKNVTYDQLVSTWKKQSSLPNSNTYMTIVGDGKFGNEGLIDLNVIDIGKNGVANNNRTFELYRQFFPLQYQDQVARVAGREISEVRMLDENGKVLTNKELLDSFDPIDKTIMDSFEIDWRQPGKEKHKTRMFGYLIGNNPNAVHKSLERTSKMQFGENGKLLPEMTFDNFKNREEEIVKSLKDVGYEEYVARMLFSKAVQLNNIQYLQNAFDYAYISNFKFFRATNAGSTINNLNPNPNLLMINATTWEPSAGGGTWSGSGLNATQGNPSNHDREVNALLQPLLNINNNEDFAIAIKEMIRQNKPLGPIDDVIKQLLFDLLGINANTYEDLFSLIPNSDKNLFNKVIKIVKTNILTNGQDYAPNAMYSGMRDLNPSVDAVGIHGGDIFTDIKKRFSGIPSLKDRNVTNTNVSRPKTLFKQNTKSMWMRYTTEPFVTDEIPNFTLQQYNDLVSLRQAQENKHLEKAMNLYDREKRIADILLKPLEINDKIKQYTGVIGLGSIVPLGASYIILDSHFEDKNNLLLLELAEHRLIDGEDKYKARQRIKEEDYYGMSENDFKNKYRESKSDFYNRLEHFKELDRIEYELNKERTLEEINQLEYDYKNLSKKEFENKYKFDKFTYKRKKRMENN